MYKKLNSVSRAYRGSLSNFVHCPLMLEKDQFSYSVFNRHQEQKERRQGARGEAVATGQGRADGLMKAVPAQLERKEQIRVIRKSVLTELATGCEN